ncbi:MAG: outer membrane lipoprotein-sorting protein [Elusimicrobia bacterium]|jgi:hypothetical protein|nr:MAG: outer membrane lipoprotein-sorting protein [Elusimicrobiota bacterium]
MKRRVRWLALCLAATPLFGAKEPLTPDRVVALADAVRNPQADYRVTAVVSDYAARAPKPRRAGYHVWVRGREKSVVRTAFPAVERGKSLLMLAKNLWIIIPGTSQPIRVSFQQRLIGEVANGDLSRANFSGDYTAVFQEITPKYYRLLLTAKTDDVTYNKIILWVERTKCNPLRAAFYSVSGRLLKTVKYEAYAPLGGRLRPTRHVIESATVKGQKSVIEFADMKVGPVDEKYFNKNYLRQLS